MLKEKYNDLLELGKKLDIKNGDVKEEGGKLHVDNNLGVDVEQLVLCDPEGRFHVLERALSAGTRGELTALASL
ncbi:MAG: hypothetical protein AAB354_10680, partial [candidate division KSB1 bacterium]